MVGLVCYQLVVMKVLTFYLASETILVGVLRVIVKALQGWVSPHLAFVSINERWDYTCFCFLPCDVWLVQSNHCLKVFCLIRMSISWSFGQNQQVFNESFILSASFDISGLPAFSVSSTEYMGQRKENPGNSPPCCYPGAEVPSQFALSATFIVFLCLFYM